MVFYLALKFTFELRFCETHFKKTPDLRVMWECYKWFVLYVIAMCDFPVDRSVKQSNSSCSEATDLYHLSCDESCAFFL